MKPSASKCFTSLDPEHRAHVPAIRRRRPTRSWFLFDCEGSDSPNLEWDHVYRLLFFARDQLWVLTYAEIDRHAAKDWPAQVFNQRFQRLTRALQKLPGKSFTLDGEIVAFNAEGKITFELVQEPRERTFPLYFVAFDLLTLGGANFMKLPLHERRKRLESVFDSWPQFASLCPATSDPSAVLQSVQDFDLEGIVSKRIDSIYRPGERPGTWLKLKTQKSDEFIVGGYIPSGRNFEELVVGRWGGKRLLFMESVRNGFTPHSRAQVFKLLQPMEACPRSDPATWTLRR